MTSFHLDHAWLTLQAGAWLSAGVLLGAFHFLTLRWNVTLLALGRAPFLTMALQLGRFALLAVVLAGIAAAFGALPLILAAAGILAARAAAVRLGAPM